jgi:CrcB protein
LKQVILIAVAGALGTVSRYGLSQFTHSILSKNFPWGTLVINVAGCFVIGLLATLFADTNVLSKELQLAATVGFLGAFTTFSAFSYDSYNFFRGGTWEMGLINIAANIIIGMLAVVGGVGVAQLIK